jgi:trehalose 6-phosphate phosphatase
MRYVLSAPALAVVREFAESRVLVALDFDGTLAPIVTGRGRAAVPRTTRALLRSLADRYPCIVVSGRARADVEKRLAGIPLRAVVGNHGAEPSPGEKRLEATVERWLPHLRDSLGGLSGVELENKRLTLSIHYRRAVKKSEARRAIVRAVSRMSFVRAVSGKQVMNLVPLPAPHKGTAVQRYRTKLRCERVIYVGDDVTDEDAFASGSAANLLGVRVGPKKRSSARYYLRNQGELNAFLRVLVSARSGGKGQGRAPAPKNKSRRQT